MEGSAHSINELTYDDINLRFDETHILISREGWDGGEMRVANPDSME